MSARAEILERLWWSIPSSDNEEAKRVASEMLDAYRDEIRREAAAEIREAAKGRPPYGYCPTVSTAKGAANLIDPEKEA